MTGLEEGDRVRHAFRGPGTIVRKARDGRFRVDFDRKVGTSDVLRVNLEKIELIGEGDA